MSAPDGDVDPLTQAMSMLDDLNDGGDGLFDDFAIDSDGEDHGGEDGLDLDDLDSSFGLEGINLDSAPGSRQGSSNSAEVAGEAAGAAAGAAGGKAAGEAGAAGAESGASEPGPPPALVAQDGAPSAGTGAAGGPPTGTNGGRSGSGGARTGADAVPGAGGGLVHPLQDAVRPAPPPPPPPHPPVPPAASSPASPSDAPAGWTSFSNTVSSFAKSAAGAVQTAVESAEAAVLQQPQYPPQTQSRRQGGGGGGDVRAARPTLQGAGGGTAARGGGRGGGGGMSYQERQRLLVQRHRAGNNSSGGGGGTSAASRGPQPAGRAGMPSLTPNSDRVLSRPAPAAAPAPPAADASPRQRPAPPEPSFMDRLNSNLDAETKTSLINSALGKLLPGERIIMFLNGVRDVKDSSFPHTFVGSDDVLSDGMRAALNGGGRGDGEDGGEESGVRTVWCCVMTYYRMALFGYRASADGEVLLPRPGLSADLSGGGKPDGKSDGGNDVVRRWLSSQNASVQFQYAHCLVADGGPGSDRRGGSGGSGRRVLQMPLASVSGVEKTLASSQRAGQHHYDASGPSSLLPGSSSGLPSGLNYTAMSQLGSHVSKAIGVTTSSTANPALSNGATSHPTRPTAPGGSGSPLGIILHGKDGGRWVKFSAASDTDARRAHEAFGTYAFPGRRNLGYLFAFESRRAEVMGGQDKTEGAAQPDVKPTRRRFVPLDEYGRQGILESRGGTPVECGGGATTSYPSPWAAVVHANASYGLCSTYPSVLVGPRSAVVRGGNGAGDGAGGEVEDATFLRRVAAFRSENRFATLTWGSREHGGSVWRSAQPKVGLQGNRSSEDERYLYAIGEEAKRANLAADARAEGGVGGGGPGRRPPAEFLRMICGRINESDLIPGLDGPGGGGGGGGVNGAGPACMLKIMDMRPKSAAMGNKTQGYGYENTNNYRGSTINFYGIGNIHAVRDAYQRVSGLCTSPGTSDLQWTQLVEGTGWPGMIRLILSAAWQAAFHVHYNRLPVLVHCSHGWDRTSQVPALAQLLLDPHYRTIEGFSTLVEKDFLSFGHPFHTRCGHGEGRNEQGGDEGQLAPIFLQFVDCVFQLVNQFPDYFEFGPRYLLLLSEHIYSCRFGTLLCDCEREREVVAAIRQRTYCVWEYLESVPGLANPTYDGKASGEAGTLLMPLPMLLRNVTLWTDRYCMYGAKATVPCVPPTSGRYPPRNTVTCPVMEQPVALHTMRQADYRLRRALDDVDMWKTAALRKK